MGIKHKINVASFSIIPVQCGVEIETPDGRGLYEGITSSGIVSVFINGGVKQYSWNDVLPDLTIDHMELIDELQGNLIEHIFLTKQSVEGGKKIQDAIDELSKDDIDRYGELRSY